MSHQLRLTLVLGIVFSPARSRALRARWAALILAIAAALNLRRPTPSVPAANGGVIRNRC